MVFMNVCVRVSELERMVRMVKIHMIEVFHLIQQTHSDFVVLDCM